MHHASTKHSLRPPHSRHVVLSGFGKSGDRVEEGTEEGQFWMIAFSTDVFIIIIIPPAPTYPLFLLTPMMSVGGQDAAVCGVVWLRSARQLERRNGWEEIITDV